MGPGSDPPSAMMLLTIIENLPASLWAASKAAKNNKQDGPITVKPLFTRLAVCEGKMIEPSKLTAEIYERRDAPSPI
jgi:hypothetical protein